jgi:alpha-galactosidase
MKPAWLRYTPPLAALLPLLLAVPAHTQSVDTLDLSASQLPADAFWVDDLDLSVVYQEWGNPGKGKTVDDHPLTLGGKTYPHGIGTHAGSEMSVSLKGGALAFIADIGVDDETEGKGSCRFEVWVDNKRAYQSGVLKGKDKPERVRVDLTGAKTLRLVVTDADDGIDHDHADWAGAMILLKPGATERPASATLAPAPPPVIWMGPDGPRPAIHGPRVVGSTPGKPFLFRIPASGEKPLRFTAGNLPAGVTLNPANGVLSGTLKKSGTTVVDLTVTGPKGTAKRKLVIVGDTGKLALTPPLGWNSWNVWGTSITADQVRAAADSFEKSGLADHGFAYINIDDGWEAGRNPDGTIQTNEKFGDMKGLADYVHAKGLKLGIYSSPGTKTCAGYEGSFGHVVQDAKSYAAWGIDYLKYDWCSYGSISPGSNRADRIWPYRLMQRALDDAPRDIVYSLCQYGMSNVWEWGASVNGNCWRTTGDITDTWSSMSGIGFKQNEMGFYAKPGRWNDPDMLVVGKLGWGPKIRQTRLTPHEQITHVSLWSLLASPLLIGCDLTQLDPFTTALLTNDDVLDINQDPLGKQALRVAKEGNTEVWARPLFDGTIAVGLFNRSTEATDVTATWAALGLKGTQPVRDLWQRKDIGNASGAYTVKVQPHGAVLVKIGKPKRTEYVP